MPDQPLTATLSVSMKVNLGNYESADAFLSVSGITQETTVEEIEALVDGPGKVAYDVLKFRIYERAQTLKARL